MIVPFKNVELGFKAGFYQSLNKNGTSGLWKLTVSTIIIYAFSKKLANLNVKCVEDVF
jgi:hypothetical protein